MVKLLNSSISIIILSLLSACSSESDGSDSETGGNGRIDNTTNIMQSPGDASQEELSSHIDGLIDDRYDGKTSDADASMANVQALFANAIGDSAFSAPFPPLHDLTGQIGANGNVEITFACDDSGSATYAGNLSDDGEGNVSVTYSSCKNNYYSRPVSGSAVASLYAESEEEARIEMYFDSLTWESEDESQRPNYSVTGYRKYHLKESNNPVYSASLSIEMKLLFELSNGKEYILEAESNYSSQGSGTTQTETASYYDDEFGKISFSAFVPEDSDYYIGYKLSGTIDAQVLLGWNRVQYLVDEDNDGTYELGAYFSSEYDLAFGDLSQKTLVSIDELSLPPEVYTPYVYNSWELYTTNDIQAEPPYLSDPDTPTEQLTYYYNWYLNGELIEDNHSNVLPAFSAVYGDTLELTIVVSDGVNHVESQRYNITIQDSPAQLLVSELPSSINVGDTVQFTANVSDPDLKDDDGTPAALLSAPEGATIDEDGNVEWTAQVSLMFSTQEFSFVLADSENSENKFTANVIVHSDGAQPLVRGSTAVPSTNKSMWTADFSGDGNNEILSTNSRNTVFLLSETDGSYQQTWLYPYSLTDTGSIRQVRAAQYDQDSELEIFVATDNAIQVIKSLNSRAETLISTEDHIVKFDIVDLDLDGKLELIYLHSSEQYHSDDFDMTIVELSAPSVELFTTNVLSSADFAIGNVDSDSQLEIVLSAGLVYDGEDFANEWFRGTSFGGAMVTLGDYDGDGIDEIAGADTWGDIVILSADDKTQLDSFDNFNTCSITTANIDNDASDELIVGDCQWGNITAYDFSNNSMTSKWAVGMQAHGSKSVTVGDTDNDGALEVFWGSGQSSSGKDILVVADLTNDEATVNEASIVVELDTFNAVGWGSTDGNNDRAVFFIPSTNSGYDGSRVLTLAAHGTYEVSDEISSNWDNSSIAAVTDYDGNGISDIFLPTTHLYNGSFSALQLSDYSEIWSLGGDHGSSIGVVKAFDANNDGFEDAFIVDGDKLQIIDINNEVFLANYSFSNSIWDFTAFHNGGTDILVSGDDRLSLLRIADNGMAELDFVEAGCNRLEMINIDDDAALEVACLEGSDYWYDDDNQIVIYEIENDKLSEKLRFDYDFKVLDISVDPSTDSNQALLVSSQTGDGYSYYQDTNKYQIKNISADGFVNWSSAPLIGQPKTHGLKSRIKDGELEVLLSTSTVMYWF